MATPNKESIRLNSVGIPMVDERMRQKLFPGTDSEPSKLCKKRAESLLGQFGLNKELNVQITPAYVDLPDLKGDNLLEHFENMSYELAQPYLSLAEKLATMEFPERPEKWLYKQGWVRYVPGETPESVDYILEPESIFDVEVAVKYANYPVMACAVTSVAWYFWCSPWFWRGADTLIPFGDSYSLAAGWNISYDRTRVLEEYSIGGSNNRFLDGMSMHIAVAGLSGKQRNHYLSVKKNMDDDNYMGHIPTWANETTTNSLKAAIEFYLGEPRDKELRNIFVNGTREEITSKFQQLANYNADDVYDTGRVIQILWKRFRRSCPSNVTFSAMLTMGTGFLPVQDRWRQYLDRCGHSYNIASDQIKNKLNDLAKKVANTYKESGTQDPDNCPWLKNLDWELPGKRAKKQRDMPAWYRKVTDLGKKFVTARSVVTPYLLKMSWMGYPLYHDPVMKWGYLVPKDSEYTTNSKSYDLEGFPGYTYYKVPHKDGEKANCGNPLAKDYLESMESGILSAEDPDAREIIELSISISYWVSVRGRAYDQFVYYDPQDSEYERGIILPQMVVAGTVTRRAVEPTWLTASNPKPNRIGSEIKTTVKIPQQYCRIGADVDSQELWLSDLIGDASVGVIGGTPSSLQTLIGTKENGKDMHTVFANDNGMSRDGAKQCNYSRRYGSGLTAQATYYRQWIKGLSDADARTRAKAGMEKTKGRKENGKYFGGTESTMFNELERIATSRDPRTPFLNCAISEALHPRNVGRDHMPSRLNWVVQSSGVDFLHCLIVASEYLFKEAGLWYRFMISVHDEVHWIFEMENRHQACYLFQIAHLWVRAFFNYQLGFSDISETVAWFSGVDVDFTWRKSPTKGCLTPSNTNALPPGKEVTIHEILEKYKGD